MTVFLLIFGMILFIGLVIIHEWGHFIVARRNGVEVEEFGIGFPPCAKVLAKKNGTVYTLNWLPLGGFVKLKGEHDSDTEPGTFGAASLWAKTKIMMAGVGMNLLSALVILTFLALVGMPTLINESNQGEEQFTVSRDERVVTRQVMVGFTDEKSPAEKAGLKPQDRLVSAKLVGQGKQTTNFNVASDLREFTRANAGKEVEVTYIRDKKQAVTNLKLLSKAEVDASLNTDQPKGYMGIVMNEYQVNRYSWSAPVVAVGVAGQFTKLTITGLGTAIKGLGGLIAGVVTHNSPATKTAQAEATEQVGGPLAIFFVMKAGAASGLGMVLMVIAVIALTLAVMNALPIPALDGGRLFVTFVYRAIRQPLTQKAEEMVHGTGFAALMGLFVLITIVDVKRFF